MSFETPTLDTPGQAESPMEPVPALPPEPKPALSAFLPLTLLGLSFAFFLTWQVNNANTGIGALQQGIAERAPLVQQSRQVQSGLQKLVIDLIAAGKDDDDAKAIIAKYNIQLGGKPAIGNPEEASPAESHPSPAAGEPQPTP